MGKKSRLKARLRSSLPPAPLAPKSAYPVKAEISALLVTTLAIFSLAFNVLKPGIPSGHDINAHVVYSKLFVDSLREGQFPVRWVEWVLNGHSFPLFNFYQVGFYYFISIINLILPSLNESLKVAILLLWWLGSLFIFLYAKRFGTLPAALAALVYAFTPYIISDVFVRASYPELTAITFGLGTLWALDRLLTQAKLAYALPLTIFLAFVIISHLPTLVIIAPILASYTFWLLIITHETQTKGIIYTFLAVILGISISAFYLFPSLLELNLVKSELLTSEYYNFHSHFVYPEQLFDTFWGYGISEAGTNDGMSFQFGILQWIIIISSILLLLSQKFTKKRRSFDTHIIFWLLVILYSTFFMHEISLSFWENIKTISYIQYPWRFLMLVSLSVSILAALSVKRTRVWLQACAIIVSLGIILLLYRSYLTPMTFLPDDYFNINSPNWRQSQGIIHGSYLEQSYLPREVEKLPDTPIKKWQILNGQNQPDTGKIKVEEKTVKNHYLAFSAQSESSFNLGINIHYFPGWKAYIDNQEVEINRDNEYAFMAVVIPQGIHKIEVKFTDTPIRSASNTITIFSLIILIIWQLSTTSYIRKLYKKYTPI